MNAIPFLTKPTAQEILKYSRIPCYDDAQRIILAETEKNNEILLVGDAGCHPSETYVIIDFAEEPKNQYEKLKSSSYGEVVHQYLSYSDNRGALRINFGRKVEI